MHDHINIAISRKNVIQSFAITDMTAVTSAVLLKVRPPVSMPMNVLDFRKSKTFLKIHFNKEFSRIWLSWLSSGKTLFFFWGGGGGG